MLGRGRQEKREGRNAMTMAVIRPVRQRARCSTVGAIQVFIRTNPFKEGDLQYQAGLTISLATPADVRTFWP